MKAEVDIKPFLKAINEFRIAEQQPCGVQVVEGVGLVASGFSYVMSKSKKINPASQVLAWEALQLAAARAGVSTRKLRAAMGMDHPFRFNPPSSRMNVSVRHELWSSKVS